MEDYAHYPALQDMIWDEKYRQMYWQPKPLTDGMYDRYGNERSDEWWEKKLEEE